MESFVCRARLQLPLLERIVLLEVMGQNGRGVRLADGLIIIDTEPLIRKDMESTGDMEFQKTISRKATNCEYDLLIDVSGVNAANYIDKVFEEVGKSL